MDFDFHYELNSMRRKYKEQPLQVKRLPRPLWMNSKHELAFIYEEKEELLKEGNIYYGYIVQANSLLFSPLILFSDCPAILVYSDAPEINAEPAILRDIAEEIYSYKEKDDSEVPDSMKFVVGAIKNEYEYQSYTGVFKLEDGREVLIYFKPVVVFRKYLPKRYLRGPLLPIIAEPKNLESVMILPKQYWSEEFKEAFW